jgi:hypothetical protein
MGLPLAHQKPAFTLAIVAILALGMAPIRQSSALWTRSCRPLPYEAADRLVCIEETSTKGNRNRIPTADYQLLASPGDLFEKAAAHLRDDVTILQGPASRARVTARRSRPTCFRCSAPARAWAGRPPATVTKLC